MDSVSIYARRIDQRGGSRRGAFKNHVIHSINTFLPDNLSYTTVSIDGVEQDVAIIDSDNLDEKTILSMPGEKLRHGGLVDWMDNYWIIYELDANTTIRQRGVLWQCNYLLRWVSEDGVIHEQWCVVEDGTKYLTGEMEDRNFIVTRGDARIAITMPKNEQTVKLNRESRFIVDDPESEKMLCFILSKPLKVGHQYGKDNTTDGVFKYVLQEVTATGDDNFELRIADYYKYYPKESNADDGTSDQSDDTGTEGSSWL